MLPKPGKGSRKAVREYLTAWASTLTEDDEAREGLLACAAALAPIRTGRPRAQRVSSPMTEQLRNRIARYMSRHPDVAQHVVAARFNVNMGRVQDVLRGR